MKRRRLIRLSACLPVYASVFICPLITFEPTVILDASWYGGDATERARDAVISNPIVSTVLNWSSFKLLRWMQYLHDSALLNNGL
jgi:hypothetical protein